MLESRTCLLPMITPASRFFMRMYRHYKNNVLPLAGGILDQPQLYAEAMEVLAGRESVLRAEELERLRRQQQHGGAHLHRGFPGDG